MRGTRMLCATVGVSLALGGGVTATASAYNPIVPSQAGRTITLDGKSMTIDDMVAIARHGARSSSPRQRASVRTTPTSCCWRAPARTSRSTGSTAPRDPAARA